LSWRLRLACRVCLQLGIDDPEAWLDTVPERVLALWAAFYRVEPWGNGYERTAAISSLLSANLAMAAASCGSEMTIQPTGDFMPSNWIGQERKKPKRKIDFDGIEKTKQMMAKRYS